MIAVLCDNCKVPLPKAWESFEDEECTTFEELQDGIICRECDDADF